MRHHPALLAPVLLLAACAGGDGNTANFVNRAGQPGLGEVREMVQSEGYRNYERPDGTFDRADFRRINMAMCQRMMASDHAEFAPQPRQNFCACMVDHLLLASDAQLRGIRSDRAYGDRARRIVMTACAPVLDGLPPDPMVAPEGEAGNAH